MIAGITVLGREYAVRVVNGLLAVNGRQTDALVDAVEGVITVRSTGNMQDLVHAMTRAFTLACQYEQGRGGLRVVPVVRQSPMPDLLQ